MIKRLKPLKSHNIQRIIFLSILIVFVFIIYSAKVYPQAINKVDLGIAKSVAMRYLLKTDSKSAGKSESDLILSLAETQINGTNLLFYVFNINTKDGFIIISADLNTSPVLCYVPDGTYLKYPEQRPPAFNEWLGAFNKQIEYSLEKKLKNLQNQDLWSAYLSKGPLDAETMVLNLTSKWDQTAFFNLYSPVANGSNGHPSSGSPYGYRAPTGCVATAMGQIINYFKWPSSSTGAHSYTDPSNTAANGNSRCGLEDLSYGSMQFTADPETYNYGAMDDIPTAPNYEISKLLKNCGVSVDMDYEYCSSWTNTFQVPEAITSHFNYSSSANYILRDDHPSDWESIIIDQIRKERPVQYRGQSGNGTVGHSWVCYGYKIIQGTPPTTQFLFNFGWGGSSDGYYSLPGLGIFGLTYANGAVIDIYPASQPNLIVQSASVPQTTIPIGVPFNIQLTMKNDGTRDADATTAAFYLSHDSILDKNDILLNNINIPALTNQQSEVVSKNITIEDNNPGHYYILIEADPDHYIHESSETDNIYSIKVTTITVPSYDYKSIASGDWSNSSTWQYYDGSSWINATTYPTKSSKTITISGGTTVTISDNLSLDQVTIESGGTVVVSPGQNLTIADGSDEFDFIVNGTLISSGTISTTGQLTFGSSSLYEHAQDGGTIPIATWDAASTCLISGITSTSPLGFSQSFGNFTWNCPSQSTNVALNTNVTIKGNFTLTNTGESGMFVITSDIVSRTFTVMGSFIQTGGVLDFSNGTNGAPAYLNVAGNFTHTAPAGSIITTGLGATNGTIIFNGTAQQILSFSDVGGAKWVNYFINSGSIVSLGSNFELFGQSDQPKFYADITVNGTLNVGTYVISESSTSSSHFYLNSGATIITANSNTTGALTTSGTNGSIQVTGTRTFSTGANYLYNGSGAQVSGSGLPLTVNSLSVAGTSNLSLTGSQLTVANSLTINTGTRLNIVASQQVTTTDFNNSGTMIINSTALNNNGSFLATGAISQPGGSVTYNRQLLTGVNGNRHFFSSPVGSNTAANSGKVTQVWGWDETTATWPVTSITALTSGKGYNLAQQAGSDGLITFTGSAVNNTSITATSPYKTGYTDRTSLFAYGSGNPGDIWAPDRSWINYGAGGWYLLGNPYTSALNAAEFISQNSASFDPHYLALYIYDGTTGQYKYAAATVPGFPGGLGSFGDNIQAGQGFFVLAIYNSAVFNFTPAMQLHNTTVPMTKSGSPGDPWPGLQLKVKYGNNEGLTTIVYNKKMSATLDPGYDVGQFSAGPDVEIYTSLVSGNNGVNFARQALPVDSCNKNIVPVGINSEKGGLITFSAFTVPLENYRFFLEDRKLGVFTDLTTDTYPVNIPEKTYGTGRFFIHASADNLTDITKKRSDTDLLNVKVWLSDNNVIIDGEVSSMATAVVYDLQGHKVLETRLTSGTYNTFPMPMAAKGLYILKLTDGTKVVVRKIVAM